MKQLDFSKKYYSKLLLFGEHIVLKGSDALAVPLPTFSGKWEFSKNKSEAKKLQQSLPAFLDYLEQLNEKESLSFQPNMEYFREELRKGLFFRSNIPTGYGVGSSGALCAAIFDVFCQNFDFDLMELKKIFGQLESFFHGSSSGTDPLICYLNQPVLIQPGQMSVVTSFPSENSRTNSTIFLLDTGIARQTGPFVNLFLKKCENESYNKMCKTELVPEINLAIQNFLNSEWDALLESFHKIGVIHYDFFAEMIPDSYKRLWSESLKKDLFKLKLCGAGGGGFILGMTKDWEKTQNVLAGEKLIPVFRF